VELPSAKLDCFVALLLAMTGLSEAPLKFRSAKLDCVRRFASSANASRLSQAMTVLPVFVRCYHNLVIASAAKQSSFFARGAKADCSRGLELPSAKLDCFVASLLAMTGLLLRSAVIASAAKQSSFCGASGQR
jgi:hypothetical protein